MFPAVYYLYWLESTNHTFFLTVGYVPFPENVVME